MTKRSIFDKCSKSGAMADDRVFLWERNASGQETGRVHCHCGKLVKPRPYALQPDSSFDQIPSHNIPKKA